MKTRKINMMWIGLGCAAAAVLVLCIISIIHFSAQDKKTAEGSMAQEQDSTEQGSYDKAKYVYANETCYTGDPYLSDVLFKEPFQRTNSYVSNNDFIAMVGEENAVMFSNRSKKAASALFDLSYQERDIDDPVLSDLLADGLHVLFANGTFTESKEETVEAINGWFIDNGISMEADYYTDKCMVFYDESRVIVRGQLVFRVYGSNDLSILQEYFGLESMEPGKEYAAILELEYISKSNAYDYDTYKLSGINLI